MSIPSWIARAAQNTGRRYRELVCDLARVRFPRLLGVTAVAVAVAVGGLVLSFAESAFWSAVVTCIVIVPVSLTAIQVVNEAPPLRPPDWWRLIWPERHGWAPRFRRKLLPALCAGLLLATVVWIAPTTESDGSERLASNIGALVLSALVALVQLVYLLVAGTVLREEGAVPPVWARTFMRGWIATGIWIAATLGPLCVSLARIEHDSVFAVFGLLITVPGLFVLGVLCRGLQAWDDDESVRHDVAGYAIQTGVVLLLLALGLVVSSLFALAATNQPDRTDEILRTLVYGVTLLLVPSAWWTLHVLGASSARRRRAQIAAAAPTAVSASSPQLG